MALGLLCGFQHPGVTLSGLRVGRIHHPVLHLQAVRPGDPPLLGNRQFLVLDPGVEFGQLAHLSVLLADVEFVGVGHADQRVDDAAAAFVKSADAGGSSTSVAISPPLTPTRSRGSPPCQGVANSTLPSALTLPVRADESHFR